MYEPEASPEILAHWRYAPDEWQRFVEYEKQMRGGEVGRTLPKMILGVVVVLSLMTIVAAISSPDFLDLRGGLGGIIIIFFVITAFLLIVSAIYWLVKRGEMSTLRSRLGEAQITLYETNINGLRFDWEFDGNRSRFLSVKRQSIQSATGEINLLEFKCLTRISVRGVYETFDRVWRVPIPRGGEREADFVIQRIYAARANFLHSQNSSSAEEPLGLAAQQATDATVAGEHDFTGSAVCLKCGASIEAVTHFKWKCKR
jgi:hypothetical protein